MSILIIISYLSILFSSSLVIFIPCNFKSSIHLFIVLTEFCIFGSRVSLFNWLGSISKSTKNLFVGLSERVLSGFYPFEKGMEIFNGIINLNLDKLYKEYFNKDLKEMSLYQLEKMVNG